MNHLQSMRVFVKVAELGSFARTASTMGISTAVVTRHVATSKNVSVRGCSTGPRAASR